MTSGVGRYGVDHAPRVIAHRGGAGLGPENTLAACERSTALGVRYLEVDLRATADDVCVAFHDAGLQRVTGVRARVGDLPWETLRGLRVRDRAGRSASIPRLEDLLSAFPDAMIMLDVKERRSVPALARAVRAQRAVGRVCLAGTDDDLLADATALLGHGVCAAMGWRSLARLVAAARLGIRPRGVTRAPYVHVPLRLGRVPVFVERLVEMAHELGAGVHVWTVNDPVDVHRLLDVGVDGVITDRPDVARSVLIARGTWPPQAAPVSAVPVSAVPVSAAPVNAVPVSAAPVSAAPVNVAPRGPAAPVPQARAGGPAPALPRPAPTVG